MTTGFTIKQKVQIISRDRELCRRCDAGTPSDIHHRLPRGMGGSAIANRISNGVLLCRSCHDWIESNRQAAMTTGWLVARGQDPQRVPVINMWGQTFYLDNKGRAVRETKIIQEDQ